MSKGVLLTLDYDEEPDFMEEGVHRVQIFLTGDLHDSHVLAAYYEAAVLVQSFYLYMFIHTEDELEKLGKEIIDANIAEFGYLRDLMLNFGMETVGNFLLTFGSVKFMEGGLLFRQLAGVSLIDFAETK